MLLILFVPAIVLKHNVQEFPKRKKKIWWNTIMQDQPQLSQIP